MNARSVPSCLALVLLYTSSHAQDSIPSDAPITLQPIIGKPYFKILKVEDEPNRHYEKWIEVNYIVAANVPPSHEQKTYFLPIRKNPDFDLKLETKEKKVDFAKRWTELRQELEGIKPNDENWQVEGPNVMQANLPTLRNWDLAQWTMKSLSTAPADTIKTSGVAVYGWITRTIEMEGTRLGERAMFKATISQFVGGTSTIGLEFGNTFDNETAQILNRDGKPARYQYSLIDGDFHKMN